MCLQEGFALGVILVEQAGVIEVGFNPFLEIFEVAEIDDKAVGVGLATGKGQGDRPVVAVATKATKNYLEIAQKFNLSLTQMALAFVNQQPFVRGNIIGATNISQLKENIESVNIDLNEEILEEANEVHSSQPNPAPIEPPEGEMIAVFTPMTSPSMLNNGPPELPRLIAASV